MAKTNVAVIFGGTNTEHEVSIVSARSIIDNLNPKKFNVLPIYISKSNQWGKLSADKAALLPKKIDTPITASDMPNEKIDVVFPVLHGPLGEDGTIQGMLEMLGLPYVGCGVLASAVCMDKVVQKQLCQQAGIKIVPYIWTNKHEFQANSSQIINQIKQKLKYPLFIKPANQGSSVGVVKAHSASEINEAINHAFLYDTKIIIEQAVTNPREIECSVLGNHQPKASVLGEIKPSNEYYDYDAKYIDGQTEAVIPAKLSSILTTKIQNIALESFKLLNCSGLARIDFLVDGQTSEIYLNELNTMPGFTSISMYPKLWAASGLTYPKLLEELIDLSLQQHAEQSTKQLSYTPKLSWHKQ